MLNIINNLKPFFEDCYRRISVREYARILKISPPNASVILNNFVKEGLLLKEEDRRYHFFSVNRKSKMFVKLQQLYYQGKFKSLFEEIEKEFVSPVIILFGSFAKTEVSKNSDIDIAVFSVSKKKINLKKYEKKYGREIQLFVFKDRKKLEKNEDLLNNILNGFIVSGSW